MYIIQFEQLSGGRSPKSSLETLENWLPSNFGLKIFIKILIKNIKKILNKILIKILNWLNYWLFVGEGVNG
jgi:hypothetical protein